MRRFLSVTTIAASLLAAAPAHAWTLTNINMMQDNSMATFARMSPRRIALHPTAATLPRTLVRTGTPNPSYYLRQAARSRPSRRQVRASARRPSRSSSSRSSYSSSSSSSSFVSTLDPDIDVSLRGRIAVLGGTSPVLGAAKAFNNAEPLRLNTVTVTLSSVATSVDQLLIYDDEGRLLGSAHLDSSVSGGKTYTLNLKTKNIVIPQREDYSFYVRAVLKSHVAGGASAELLKIASIAVGGDGFWSNRAYTQSLTGTFNTHETARSVITSIVNAGAISEPLLGGNDREIGKFRFAGVRGDGGADLRLTQLSFTLSQVGGITLNDVELMADGSSDRASCTVSSSTITCPLSASFGSLSTSARTLTLLASVAIPSGLSRASLQVSLNEPGMPSSAGAIQWTDGTTTFDWVGFEAPVVRGTYYSY